MANPTTSNVSPSNVCEKCGAEARFIGVTGPTGATAHYRCECGCTWTMPANADQLPRVAMFATFTPPSAIEQAAMAALVTELRQDPETPDSARYVDLVAPLLAAGLEGDEYWSAFDIVWRKALESAGRAV